LDRLGLNYLDLYLIHTPFAFQPGDEQDPRDESGNVLYDNGVTMLDTWRAMESLVDHGKCRAIGLSDINLNELLPICESARIKPAVVQVESHPYLPETELLEFCKETVLYFWRARHWVTELGRGRSKTQSFRQSPHELKRRPRKCCWHGRYSAERLCLPRPELPLARERISTFPPFRKTRSTKSIAFRLDRGSMK
jgi:hypothetical protein